MRRERRKRGSVMERAAASSRVELSRGVEDGMGYLGIEEGKTVVSIGPNERRPLLETIVHSNGIVELVEMKPEDGNGECEEGGRRDEIGCRGQTGWGSRQSAHGERHRERGGRMPWKSMGWRHLGQSQGEGVGASGVFDREAVFSASRSCWRVCCRVCRRGRRVGAKKPK